MMKLGRVAAIHPEDHSVDLVMVHDGARLAGVQVMAWSASTDSGTHDMPPPATPASGDVWDLRERTARDLIAVVGYVEGRMPLVMGFLYPQVSQMLFKDHGRRVSRHVSDVYSTVDSAGNAEFYHPSGAFVRIASSPAHEDLTGKDVDGKWKITKNTGSKVHIHVEQAGGVAAFDIDPNGNINVTSAANLTAVIDGAASLKAASYTVDAPTEFKKTVVIDGAFSFLNGMRGQAGTSGGPTASLEGDMTVTGGEVTVDGIGVKGHHHDDPQGGETSNAKP